MMNKKVLMTGLALATAFLLLPSGAAGGGSTTEDYANGPLGDVSWNAPSCDPLLAQACYTAPAAGMLTITIADASTLPVAFYIDGEGAGVCVSATRPVVAGQVVHVTANGPAFGALDCTSTTATVGTFTFTLA